MLDQNQTASLRESVNFMRSCFSNHKHGLEKSPNIWDHVPLLDMIPPYFLGHQPSRLYKLMLNSQAFQSNGKRRLYKFQLNSQAFNRFGHRFWAIFMVQVQVLGHLHGTGTGSGPSTCSGTGSGSSAWAGTGSGPSAWAGTGTGSGPSAWAGTGSGPSGTGSGP